MNDVFALATDTAWGLACDASNPQLTDKIYFLKGRTFTKPLILFTCSIKKASKLIEIPTDLLPWLDHHWPGDLTLVSKATTQKYKHCHKQSPFLGVRIPNLASTLNYLKEQLNPLAVTSFNQSNHPNVESKDRLKSVFPNFNPKVIGDMPIVTTESAVLCLENNNLKVLRAQDIQVSKLQEFLPKKYSLQYISEQK